MDLNLVKDFSTRVIAPALFIFGLICYFDNEIFNKIVENNFISLIIFLPIVGGVFLLEKIAIFIYKRYEAYQIQKNEKVRIANRLEQNKKDFKKLDINKQSILWSVFFKSNEGFFTHQISDLIKNLYLIETTQLKKERLDFSIVELPKEIEKFLEEEHNRIIKGYLISLSEEEKVILSLFINKSEDEEYAHPLIKKEEYSSLYKLREKKLINFEDKKDIFIELSEYSIKNFATFSPLEIQRTKISLNLENVEPSLLTWKEKKQI